MRWFTVITAALVALLLPASAQAWNIREVTFRDAGNRIVSKVMVCHSEAARFHFTIVTNYSEGGDKRVVRSYGDLPHAGCGRFITLDRDRLKWKGWYVGRVKVRLGGTDWVQRSRWVHFYSR
jgi:hypothetical protein